MVIMYAHCFFLSRKTATEIRYDPYNFYQDRNHFAPPLLCYYIDSNQEANLLLRMVHNILRITDCREIPL